jgi:hypothetical protein
MVQYAESMVKLDSNDFSPRRRTTTKQNLDPDNNNKNV